MISFACLCGRELQTPDELAGRQIRCPSCSEVRTVPGEPVTGRDEERPEPRAEPRPEPRPARPNRRRPVQDEDDDYGPIQSEPDTTSAKSGWSLGLGVSSFLCLFLTGIPAVILGSMAISEINRSRGRVGGQGLAIGGIVTGVLGTLMTLIVALIAVPIMMIAPAIQAVQNAAVQAQTNNNLRLLGLAMNNYAADNGTFPPAAGGKKMHPELSWRVALLPYLGDDLLYRQFHLDEPWNSPHNKRLLQRMPTVFTIPGVADPSGTTRYRVFVGKGAAFEMPGAGAKAPAGRRLADFLDPAETILVFEAADAVRWTEPDELVFAPGDRPLPPLSPLHGGPRAVMVNGTVRTLDPDTPEADFRALITGEGDK